MALGALLCAAMLILACSVSASPRLPLPPGWRVFEDTALGYAIAYPRGWTVEKNYVYSGFGPGHEIHGVAFHIPPSMARGTNLSANLTAVSLESVNGSGRCDANSFLPDQQNAHSIAENGAIYSTAQSEDAGAGNFYSETVFALTGSSPCVAIRYFIHSTNIANYDPGTVREFDHAKLMEEFDRIRRTLVLSRPAHPQVSPR